MGHDDHDHGRGLSHDLRVLAAMRDRRRVLQILGGAGLATLFGCSSSSTDGGSSGTSGGSGTSGTSGGGSCAEIPEETAGPYPGDGSNGPNALTLSGVVRSDIRSSFAGATGVAEGVLLTVTLTIVDASNGCAPLAGHAVYLWHCDRAGGYSMYSQAVASENYLRGVQVTGADGTVTFTTIFPAAYSGRWPHIHFEVYPGVDQVTSSRNKIATSQLALPEAACNAVYAQAGYSASIPNMSRTTLANDNVFSDGSTQQLAAIAGDVTSGYAATLTVPVAG